ncbi:MAG TPA: hypothetical protein VFN37_10025 [Candidatus Baltobacteraceae bacterium]|nr:hypothetical protein [Candidatus Baltobacteraceae bacterium]
MLRALFSLAASCYIIAALAIPGFWLSQSLRLRPAAWWPAYFGIELVLLGAPISAAVWQLVWQPAAALQAARPQHLPRLIGMVLLVIYAFLVVPAACFIALPRPVNLIAGCTVFGVSAVAALAYFAGRR